MICVPGASGCVVIPLESVPSGCRMFTRNSAAGALPVFAIVTLICATATGLAGLKMIVLPPVTAAPATTRFGSTGVAVRSGATTAIVGVRRDSTVGGILVARARAVCVASTCVAVKSLADGPDGPGVKVSVFRMTTRIGGDGIAVGGSGSGVNDGGI